VWSSAEVRNGWVDSWAIRRSLLCCGNGKCGVIESSCRGGLNGANRTLEKVLYYYYNLGLEGNWIFILSGFIDFGKI